MENHRLGVDTAAIACVASVVSRKLSTQDSQDRCSNTKLRLGLIQQCIKWVKVSETFQEAEVSCRGVRPFQIRPWDARCQAAEGKATSFADSNLSDKDIAIVDTGYDRLGGNWKSKQKKKSRSFLRANTRFLLMILATRTDLPNGTT